MPLHVSTYRVQLEDMPLQLSRSASFPAATVVDLSLATGNEVHITGSSGPITSFGTVPAGTQFILVFDSTPTLTYHATSLILNTGGSDYTCTAGDRVLAISEGSGNWLVTVHFDHSDEVEARWFGQVADGVTDDAAAINSAITWAASQGKVLRLRKGVSLCSSPIVLQANTKIKADPGAVLLRNCATTGNSGFFGGSSSSKTNDCEIEGLEIRGQDTTTYRGNVFAIYGDNVVLRQCKVDTYGTPEGGRAVLWRGDNGMIDSLEVVNPSQTAGTGGIRFMAGTGFRCINSHVISGDDAFQFVPSASNDQSIYDGQYICCTGGSYTSRLMIAALVDPVAGNTTASFVQPAVDSTVTVSKTSDNRYAVDDRVYVSGGGYYTCTAVNSNTQFVLRNDGDSINVSAGTTVASGAEIFRADSSDIESGAMTCSIKNVSFIGVKGWSQSPSANALTIRNSDSSGVIDGVTVTDCSIDLTDSDCLYAAYVEGSIYGTYLTKNISISGLRLLGTPNTALRVIGSDAFGHVKGLHVSKLFSDKSETSSVNTVQFLGVEDSSISHSNLWANGTDGILMGSSGKTCVDVQVGPRVTMLDIADSQAGVQLAYATNCVISQNRFVRLSGATLSRGVGNGANATSTSLQGNDYSSVDSDIVSSNASEGTLGNFDIAQGIGSSAGIASIGKFRTADGSSALEFYSDTSGDKVGRIQRNSGATGALLVDNFGTGQIQLKINNTAILSMTSAGVITFSGSSGRLKIVVPSASYADDAAAAAAGYAVGDIYRNGSVLQVRVS